MALLDFIFLLLVLLLDSDFDNFSDAPSFVVSHHSLKVLILFNGSGELGGIVRLSIRQLLDVIKKFSLALTASCT